MFTTANDTKIKQWDLRTFKCVNSQPTKKIVTSMRFTDSGILCCTGKGICQIKQLKTDSDGTSNEGSLHHVLWECTGTAAISPNGDTLVTLPVESMSKEWDLWTCTKSRFKKAKSAKSAIYN